MENHENDKRSNLATIVYVVIIALIIAGCSTTINFLINNDNTTIETEQRQDSKNDSIHINTDVK